MKTNDIILIIILVVVVGVVAFVGGVQFQKYQQRSGFARQFGGQGGMRNGQGQSQPNRQGFRPVNGEIISSDDKSITVKLQDGSSKIVLVSDKTTINKAQEGTKDDLKTGEKVMVVGQENADGSVTAQNIQLNPIVRGVPAGASPK